MTRGGLRDIQSLAYIVWIILLFAFPLPTGLIFLACSLRSPGESFMHPWAPCYNRCGCSELVLWPNIELFLRFPHVWERNLDHHTGVMDWFNIGENEFLLSFFFFNTDTTFQSWKMPPQETRTYSDEKKKPHVVNIYLMLVIQSQLRKSAFHAVFFKNWSHWVNPFLSHFWQKWLLYFLYLSG